MSDVPNWRDRVASAAAADVGWTGDEPTIPQARRLVDHAVVGAKLGVGILAALGALFGLIAASSVFGPAAGLVFCPPGGQREVIAGLAISFSMWQCAGHGDAAGLGFVH